MKQPKDISIKILADNRLSSFYLLSLIIPFRIDSTKYFFELLNSLENLDTRVEIILVDDSTEQRSLIEETARKISNYKNCLLASFDQNHGVSFSRNIGIDLSRGKYVSFIDSDDLINIEMIPEILTYIETHNTDMMCMRFGTFTTVADISFSLSESIVFSLSDKTGKELYSNYLYFDKTLDSYFFRSSCGKLFLRETIIANSVAFPENVLNYEDACFLASFCSNSKTIVFCNGCDSFYYYRNNEKSVSKSYCSNLTERLSLYYSTFSKLNPSYKDVLCLDTLYLLLSALAKNEFLHSGQLRMKVIKNILDLPFVSKSFYDIQKINVSNSYNVFIKRIKKLSALFPIIVSRLYLYLYLRKYLVK